MIVLALAWQAHALEYRWQDDPHTYRVEVYYQATWLEDQLQPVDIKAWVMQMTCAWAPADKGFTSTCTPVDDEVYVGFLLPGMSEIGMVALPFDATVTAAWTDRGRLRSHDVVVPAGERFWHAYIDASDRELGLRTNITATDLEDFGRNLERGLASQFLGALEVELPKDGDVSKAWKQGGSYQALRMFGQSSVAARMKHEVRPQDGDRVELHSAGTATEQPTGAQGSTQATLAQMTFEGVAVFEAGVLSERQLVVTTTGPGYGWAATMAVTGFAEPPGGVERVTFDAQQRAKVHGVSPTAAPPRPPP